MTGRRTHAEAADAAEAASNAARILQERGQQAAAEKRETLHLPKKEPKVEKAEPKEAAKPEKNADDRETVDIGLKDRLPRGNIHRDAMMEEIREKRGEGKESKAEEVVEKKDETTGDAATHKETTPVEAASTEAAPAEAVATEAPVMVEMVRVKVDGEETQVPKADVDAEGGVVAYQMNRAAQKRLKQTNDTLAETKRTQAALAEWAKQQKPVEAQVTDDQFIESKMDTLTFGTPQEKAAALREVIARANPRLDQNLLISQATTSIKRDTAHSKYLADFNDVLANPVARIAAESIERTELSKFLGPKGPDWGRLAQLDWQKFYGIIGTQVRNAMGTRQNQPAQSAAASSDGNTSQLSEKEARKASIVEPPKAAAARAASKEEPTLTPEEARQASLREMRKSRGLPVD